MQEGRVAGVDWASEEHAVCVVDGEGRIVEGHRYRHDERGIRALCARLLELEVRLVAIERPDGLLIERLLDAGLAVIAVHPNQVAAMRPRFSAAGGKSDNFDAFVLAELARTDSHRFRVLVPDSDQTKALRALTRAREDLVATRVALANELRAQLDGFWPGAARVFADIDSPIALALVAAIEPLVTRITELTSEIREALNDHPDGETFRSLFKDPRSAVCAATMLAEIGDCRERYPTRQTLAADAGQAPVAVESGKSKRARFRWACDHRLRSAIATMADTSRHHNPWAADIYTRARARGANHAHAIRILGRAWCAVLWRLWQAHDVYDPNRHTALQRLLATTTTTT